VFKAIRGRDGCTRDFGCGRYPSTVTIKWAGPSASDLSLSEFKAKALQVRDWFKHLNPYGEDRSILLLEKVNFPVGKDGDLNALDPPQCLAVSAKRYVLFNRQNGVPVMRKASGHGLGHLLAPRCCVREMLSASRRPTSSPPTEK
jgi:hypothetical protein